MLTLGIVQARLALCSHLIAILNFELKQKNTPEGVFFVLCVDICVVGILLDELAAGRYVVTHQH